MQHFTSSPFYCPPLTIANQQRQLDRCTYVEVANRSTLSPIRPCSHLNAWGDISIPRPLWKKERWFGRPSSLLFIDIFGQRWEIERPMKIYCSRPITQKGTNKGWAKTTSVWMATHRCLNPSLDMGTWHSKVHTCAWLSCYSRLWPMVAFNLNF